MTDEAVGAIIESRVKTWSEAQGYPVRFGNQDFDPSTQSIDGMYLECFILPARTGSETLDGAHRHHNGVVQINIRCKRGIGSAVTRRITGELDVLFPNAGLVTDSDGVTVRFTSPVSAAPAIEDANGYFVPVSFNYRSDA